MSTDINKSKTHDSGDRADGLSSKSHKNSVSSGQVTIYAYRLLTESLSLFPTLFDNNNRAIARVFPFDASFFQKFRKGVLEAAVKILPNFPFFETSNKTNFADKLNIYSEFRCFKNKKHIHRKKFHRLLAHFL